MLLKILTKPIRIFGIEVHQSVLVLFLIAFGFGFLRRLSIAYVITALHECAHILTARRLGIKIEKTEILPFGITARLCNEGIKNPWDEVVVALSGPLCNLLIAYLSFCLSEGWWQNYIFYTSLVIGVFNLIPALPLDGGRVLKAIMVSCFGCIRGYGIAMRVTAVFGVAIVLFGIWVFYVTGFNFSFLLIGAFLIANITEETKASKIVVMKDILYSRQKLKESPCQRCGVLVVTDEENAWRVLWSLTYNRYYIINIADGEGKILRTITETAFVQGLGVWGTNIPMRKFVGL